MNVCLYMRMSTNMQEHSIDSQRKVLAAYALGHGMTIVSEYADEGISGRKADKRPGFLQMITDSAGGAFAAVLIYDSSRFARNLEESLVYKSILKRNGVALVSATEPNLDDETAVLTDALLGAMNEMYSLKLSQNVRRGMIHNAQNGVYQCAPPYGYVIAAKKTPPVVVPAEAVLVRRVFAMAQAGEHAFSIARALNRAGCCTRAGKPWERRAVERILRNPMYKGEVVWNHTNDRICAKGRHEPIISADMFGEVQTQLAAAHASGHARPPSECRHWLSGIMKCGACGGTMTYSARAGGHDTFGCNRYKKGTCMVCNSISRAKAEKCVLDAMAALVGGTPIQVAQRAPCAAENAQGQLRAEVARMQKKMARIRVAYEEGIDTLSEYKRRKKAVSDELARLRAQLSAAGKSSEEEAGARACVTDVQSWLLDDSRTMAERNSALRRAVDGIVYDGANRELTVFVRF